MKTDNEAISAIEDISGCDVVDILNVAIWDSTVIGICMNDGCDYTTDVEPDQDKGWCECCDTKTVKSLMRLALC